MAKQESIEVEGTIKEALPGARFRVSINLGGKEHEVLAHVSGKMSCLLYTSPSPRDED